jgi:DNA-binding IclR family transcriptional regulator
MRRGRAISVQPNQSAVRTLEVLEAIAAHAPVGVSALARLLGTDKNAVQRAIVTLAETGWIAAAPGPTTRWELTAHIFAVAHMAHGKNDLRTRARAELERLRNETGETAVLTLVDLHRLIVSDVAVSPHILSASPSIGAIASPRDSASGHAILPYLSAARQAEMLGSAPDAAFLEGFEATRRLGHALVTGAPMEGVTTIAAPIFEADGRPVGAMVLAGPTERLSDVRLAKAIALVQGAAHKLSRGAPAAP